MDSVSSPEERLREACSSGDFQKVKDSVHQGVNINSQHSINGWTPLHWAAKRSHGNIVRYLIDQGAELNLTTMKGELPWQVADNESIQSMLEIPAGASPVNQEKLPITANYLTNPAFPYVTDSPSQQQINHNVALHASNQRSMRLVNNSAMSSTRSSINNLPIDLNELVLKARIAYMDEKDFIEIELSRNELAYENLKTHMCQELGVDQRNVFKIRKLPNTIIRKDKDVNRLIDYQELELVLHSRIMSAASRNYGPQPKNEQILY